MMSNDLIFRKLSETQADKRKFVYNCLLRQYGSLDLIPLEAWREVLPKESYRVCRLNGMESIGSGTLTKNHLPGIYSCICCGAELFDSNDKYGSMGWLSFCRSIGSDKNVERVPDMRYETKRIEIQCKNVSLFEGDVC
jgi:peptide-methionine (R)-S-oxide reductase